MFFFGMKRLKLFIFLLISLSALWFTVICIHQNTHYKELTIRLDRAGQKWSSYGAIEPSENQIALAHILKSWGDTLEVPAPEAGIKEFSRQCTLFKETLYKSPDSLRVTPDELEVFINLLSGGSVDIYDGGEEENSTIQERAKSISFRRWRALIINFELQKNVDEFNLRYEVLIRDPIQ